MSDHIRDRYLARIAGEIVFGDQYLDLLGRIYSSQDTMVEFETDPKDFLIRHGIHIPSAIAVVIHDPGAVGRPARVDFHWDESAQVTGSDVSVARLTLRELARIAWDMLHSPEMKQLSQTVQTSPAALREFTSNPKAYAAAHQVAVPDEIELIVHQDEPDGLSIHAHFGASADSVRPALPTGGTGCCYCSEGACCYYFLM